MSPIKKLSTHSTSKLRKAFTLVELLVVMVIIGILIGLAVFGLSAAQRSARDTNRRNDLRNIVLSMETFALRNSGRYPSSSEVNFKPTQFSYSVGAGVTTVDPVDLKSVSIVTDTNTNCTYSSGGSGQSDSRKSHFGLSFTSSGFTICVDLETDNKGAKETRGGDN